MQIYMILLCLQVTKWFGIKLKSFNKISINIFTEMRTTLVNAGCILCLVVAINFHPIVGNVEDEGISPPMNNAIQEYV